MICIDNEENNIFVSLIDQYHLNEIRFCASNKIRFSVLDPDGKLRTVKYTADKKNGFHASVITDGHVVHHPQDPTQPIYPDVHPNVHSVQPHVPPVSERDDDEYSDDNGGEETDDESDGEEGEGGSNSEEDEYQSGSDEDYY